MALEGHLAIGRFLFCMAVLVMAGACAPVTPPSSAPEPAPSPGSLGVLDAAYDRTKWRWVRNPDGRSLLAHTELQKCFLDPQPDEDFHDPGFSMKREAKTIGNTRYQVVSVFEQRQLWEVIYVRAGGKTPILGVYSSGKCQEEAERILENYEKRRP